MHHEIACPSGFTFLARSFGGAELQGIAERTAPSAAGNIIAHVLHGCHVETTDAGPYPDAIASVGTAKPNFRKVLFTDAWAALLILRNKSFPKFAGEYRFQFNCGSCRELVDWTAPLDAILSKTKPLPDSSYEKLKSAEHFESVIDGTRVRWDLPRIAQQDPMREFMRKNGIREDSPLTQICRQMTFLEGAKRQEIAHFWKWTLGLTADTIDELIYEMDRADARVDTQLVVRCTECKMQQKIFAPLGKSFFRPRLEMLEAETPLLDSSSASSTASTTS